MVRYGAALAGLPSPSQSADASCATSPTGGGKSTPVGVGQVVVRQTCSQLRLTTRSPGLTAVHLAPPVGELSAKLTERGVWATFPTVSTKSRFHGTPRNPRNQRFQRFQRFHGTLRKARNQRFQRNHDFTAPQRNHESNETHENNEMPLLRAFRFFRCVWRNRDFVATVGARQKARRVVY